MKISLHKNFVKKYGKLRGVEKKRFKERRDIFLEDPYNSALNNHPLRGKYNGYRSINITGDLRAIYKYISEDECVFVAIDTHSNLYS